MLKYSFTGVINVTNTMKQTDAYMSFTVWGKPWIIELFIIYVVTKNNGKLNSNKTDSKVV